MSKTSAQCKSASRKIRRLGALFWCLLTLKASAQLPQISQLLSAGRQPVTIVCLGDSITGVYYHSGGVRAYPEMLEIALQRIYP